MRSIPFIFVFCIFWLCWSCNEPSNQKEEQAQNLYQEVMTIHDDVMPKAADISRLSRKFKAALKTEQDSVIRTNYEDMIRQLTEADDAMMDWMRTFKAPDDIEERINYLKSQRSEIEKVRDLMLESLSDGMKLMPQNKIDE